MKETETLDDYKDMRATICFFSIFTPVDITHDYTMSIVHDAYYFGKSKPEMKFINEYALSNESGFLAFTLTANGLKASLSNSPDDIVNALSDMVARSLLLSVLIESHERLHLIYEAPIPIGVTLQKELTRRYEIVYQKKKGKRGRNKNSEIDIYALASAFPVSESFMPGKTFFRVGGNNVYSHPESFGVLLEDTGDGFSFRVYHADNDEVRRALELCGYIDEGRKDCFTRFPKTVIGTCPDLVFRTEDNAAVDRAGRVNNADGWTGFADLLHNAVVTEFIPGNNGRIFMIFEADRVIRDIDYSCAYDDEQYLIKRINGCLKAIGPFDRVKEESTWFTAVFSPVEAEDGHGAEGYAFSGAFPGRPDLNPLVEGLEEGDMIYGSEVNARRLQPVVPES